MTAIRGRPLESQRSRCRGRLSAAIRDVGLSGKRLWHCRVKKSHGKVANADALDFLRLVHDGVADLVFLDPPFNLGKTYSASKPDLDRKSEPDYRRWLFAVICESSRILKPGGALFLYHLPVWAVRCAAQMEALGLEFHQWIAISMKGNFARGNHLYPAHYALLMFTKGEPAHFTRPKLSALKCRHCRGYVKDYGGYRKIIEEKGINLSDFWDDLSPVRHSNRKNRPGNELPPALFDRVIAISGVRGGLYVDPFVGSGTGPVCAVAAGMDFLVCDLVESSCKITRARLKQLTVGGKTTSADTR